MILRKWEEILVALKEAGCKLICFSDLHIVENKIDKKLNAHDQRYEASTKLYDAIENGRINLNAVNGIPEDIEIRPLKTVVYGMAIVAQEKCDEFRRSAKHEADLEIARFAEQHNVMAVLSSDADFFIFGASWRIWSTRDNADWQGEMAAASSTLILLTIKDSSRKAKAHTETPTYPDCKFK